MSTEIVDQVTEQMAGEPVDEAPKVTEETQVEDEAQPAKTEEDPPFPKKAINALSKRDKRIGRLEQEIKYLRQQVQPPAETPKSTAPTEDQYDNYGDYLKAAAKWEARQEYSTAKQEDQQSQLQAKEQEWVAEREEAVAELAREAIKTVPDFEQILAENADTIDVFPPAIQRVFLEADNAPMAFYALAKEGRLEDLARMSPARAAIEIGKAEDRGIAMTKTKPVTKAPTPISSNKGTAPSSLRAENMSGDELLKQIRKR